MPYMVETWTRGSNSTSKEMINMHPCHKTWKRINKGVHEKGPLSAMKDVKDGRRKKYLHVRVHETGPLRRKGLQAVYNKERNSVQCNPLTTKYLVRFSDVFSNLSEVFPKLVV